MCYFLSVVVVVVTLLSSKSHKNYQVYYKLVHFMTFSIKSNENYKSSLLEYLSNFGEYKNLHMCEIVPCSNVFHTKT